MKRITYTITLYIAIALFSACKKEVIKTLDVSSINFIDASQAVPAFSANFTFNPIGYSRYKGPNQSPPTYGNYVEFANPAGSLPLELISSLDTLHSFYKTTLDMKAGGVYSMYIIGQTNAETMLLEDHIPAYQDSTSGVRFINLSPDSQPLAINLAGNPPSQTELTSLEYKQISDFKGYSAKAPFINNGYTFEVRDAANGNLLTTFSWYIKPFFCNTLVIYGLEHNGSGNFPLRVLQVNHY